jgi:hypothetical protein
MAIEEEKLLSMAKAFQSVTGYRPHNSTLLRWAVRGAKTVKLETRWVGSRRMTSIEAVRRFQEARNSVAVQKKESSGESPKSTKRRADRAEQELRRQGM